MEDQPRVPLGIYKVVFVDSKPPVATGAHNTCFQQVQDDTSKARSVNRGSEFVSKGTEFSLGKFVPEYFTPLTLDSRSDVVSIEDTVEIWEETREEMVKKVKEGDRGAKGTDSPISDGRCNAHHLFLRCLGSISCCHKGSFSRHSS